MKSILEPCHRSGIWHPDRSRRRIGIFSKDHPLHQIPVPAGGFPGLPVGGIGDRVTTHFAALSAHHFATASLDETIGLTYRAWQSSESLRHLALRAFEIILVRHKKFDRDKAAISRAPHYRT